MVHGPKEMIKIRMRTNLIIILQEVKKAKAIQKVKKIFIGISVFCIHAAPPIMTNLFFHFQKIDRSNDF